MNVQNLDLHDDGACKVAHSWVTGFAKAIQSTDPADVAALFCPNGFWRDCVAASRQIQTVETAAKIGVFATEIRPQNRLQDIRMLPQVKQENGVVLGEFEFRTDVFKGTAHFKLLDGHCLMLGTYAEELITPIDTADTSKQNTDTIIIGAGHAGLSLAAWLKHLGVKVTIYDAQDRPGDTWRKRYASLKLHDPTSFNHLPFRPFPKSWPDLAPKDMLADFLTEYASELQLDVVPRTWCTSASYSEGAWQVELQSGGQTRSVKCRNLVLATGRFAKPMLPEFPGMDSFDGAIHHAAEFRDGAAYTGKKVTVVGAANTAFDISHDLAKHGAEVTLLQRSPVSLISQKAFSDMLFARLPDGFDGLEQPNAIERDIHAIPARLYLESAVNVWKSTCETDKDLHARLSKAGLMLDDGYEGTGVFGQYKLGGTGLVVDQGAGEWIADGRIAVKNGAIGSIEPAGIRLENGDEIAADAIICATGYHAVSETLAALLGDDAASRIGPVWGPGAGGSRDPGPWTGEHRNVWTPTALQGLWFHGGSLGISRFYSHLLALQIAAPVQEM